MRAILITAVAVLALAGCGQKVERHGDKTIVTGAGGVQSTVVTGPEAKAAVAALPAYAPGYPGATPVATTQTSVNGVKATAVTLSTHDTPDQVVAFYKGRLQGAGMGQVTDINLGLGRMVIAEDAATGQGVQVMVMKAQGETRIQITQSSTKPKA